MTGKTRLGDEIVRRQYGVGGAIPAGSGCIARPDPHSLPARFEARDGRADGGIRHIEINRERIVVRRAVSGMRMAINVRVSDYIGIAIREVDATFALMLVHRDPGLSVPLLHATDTDEMEQAWTMWADALALPRTDADSEADGPLSNDVAPAPRRRRHSYIKFRRPRIRMNRRTTRCLALAERHIGEREIIARN